MRFPWAELATTCSLAWAIPASAQQGIEVGLQAIATASDPAAGVLGVYAADRLANRTRVSGFLGLGAAGDGVAWRGELLVHFLLNPEKRQGAGFYLAGGAAGAKASVTTGYLVLTIGVEARPAAQSGWNLEAGVGGGVRLALGYRWRHYRPGVP